ncbi:MAG: rRNA pseudouridine synthase, partial [Acidimicrobiia bacterium]|nr:rRNA pseudouridine synthase [Acidimicrobiia bacterium]
AGLMSRRAAEKAISSGRVSVDGRTAILGDRVDVESEEVRLDGSVIPVNPALVTYLVYKPMGVISTADDPQGRDTVVQLVPEETRIYPVGRLDSDSEGLILLTNDGRLADLVTHPRYGIHKRYLAEVAGVVRPGTLRKLEGGIVLDDGPAAAIRARLVGSHGDRSQVEVLMGEGRNRQVRRMFDYVGYPVLRLVRTAIGPLSDSGLQPGQSRLLTSREVAELLAGAKAEQ